MTPAAITLGDAQKFIKLGIPLGYLDSKLMYDGDHWAGGRFWMGPRPQATDPNGALIMAEIQAALVSQNAILEVVRRHRDGVVGREPSWALSLIRPLEDGATPTTDEQALIDEGEAALTEWWDKRRAHGALKEAVSNLLLSGRGILRLFVPRNNLDEKGQVKTADLRTSMQRIRLSAPLPDAATVYEDPDTLAEAGLYVYVRAEDSKQFYELQYLDEKGRTVLQLSEASQANPAGVAFDLGGRLTLFEMKRAPLITEQVRQSQRLLNQALTMLPRNVNLAGFMKMVLTNVDWPGKMVPDATAEDGQRFEPNQIPTGPGVINNFHGIVTQDKTGNESVATPGVYFKDPIPIQTFSDTKAVAYEAILQETEQIHVLTNSDASASGESRKQAREGFEKSLGDTKPEVDRAIRWMLETVLALASVFSGQPGRFSTLRATAECRLDSGSRTTDEDRGVLELFNGGLLSRETAMSRIGVEDVDAEQGKMDAEKESEMNAGLLKAQAAADAALHDPAQMPPVPPVGSNGTAQKVGAAA